MENLENLSSIPALSCLNIEDCIIIGANDMGQTDPSLGIMPENTLFNNGDEPTTFTLSTADSLVQILTPEALTGLNVDSSGDGNIIYLYQPTSYDIF